MGLTRECRERGGDFVDVCFDVARRDVVAGIAVPGVGAGDGESEVSFHQVRVVWRSQCALIRCA